MMVRVTIKLTKATMATSEVSVVGRSARGWRCMVTSTMVPIHVLSMAAEMDRPTNGWRHMVVVVPLIVLAGALMTATAAKAPVVPEAAWMMVGTICVVAPSSRAVAAVGRQVRGWGHATVVVWMVVMAVVMATMGSESAAAPSSRESGQPVVQSYVIGCRSDDRRRPVMEMFMSLYDGGGCRNPLS
jgi:hypothetical protein